MTYQDFLGLFSVVASVYGYGIYIRSILTGKTKPHLFSWGVWAVVMGIVCAAQLSKGAGAGAWVTGSSACACFIIAMLSIRDGEKNITRSDWVALIGALLIIPMWQITHDPLSAVIMAIGIDAMAYYPTFRKSYLKPYEENYLTYCVDNFKWVVAFFAFQNYSLTTLIYPMFIFTANGLLICMVLWRRRTLPKS